MPLVINSLGGGHTHANTRIQTIRTGSILRNQVRAGRRPGRGRHAPGLKTIMYSTNLNFSAQNIILLSINIAEKSWIIYIQYIFINYML